MVVAKVGNVPVELIEKPSRRALGKYATTACIVVVTAWAAFEVDHWAAWISYWILASVMHLGLLASGHELVHHHLFNSRRTNNVVNYIISFLTLVPAAAYRFYHLKHHAKLGTGDDPEGILNLELNRLQLVGALTLSGFIVLGDLWSESIRAALGRPLRWGRGAKARRALVLDIAVFVGSVSAIAVGSAIVGFGPVAFAWLIPILISMSFWSAFIALPEHYGLRGGAEPADISRNVSSNRLFSWLYWETNFHATHHWAPHVPYNHLRSATVLREWPNEESSYLALWSKWLIDPSSANPDPASVIDLRDKVVEPTPDQPVEGLSR